eukprot:c49843_g1_i1 orf=1-189(-)
MVYDYPELCISSFHFQHSRVLFSLLEVLVGGCHVSEDMMYCSTASASVAIALLWLAFKVPSMA